jgi:hypothetical protein
MRKTAVSMQMKLAVIRLRNEHQSIRNIAKALGPSQQFGSSIMPNLQFGTQLCQKTR